MIDPTRGARLRRSGRRPGWILMTVLLVLAIAASSALVFTSRVELLKLAVILALWAAVVAAFVSVIYRRQSDSDQAKVRDLKLVYDLQLEREISARREYELTVESHLRRELAAELREQSADEVAALRAELAALRANLEYLFDADLSHRPAIEDRSQPALGEWRPGTDTAGRVSSSRVDTAGATFGDDRGRGGDLHVPDTVESPIIDVPAVPHPAEDEPAPTTTEPVGAHRRGTEDAPRRRYRDEPAPAPSQWAPPASAPSQPPTEPRMPWLPPTAPAPPAAPPPAAAPRPPAPGPGRPAQQPQQTEYVGRRRRDDNAEPAGRHYAPPPAAPQSEPPPSADDERSGAHTGGQSVAELLARLQASPGPGGRRRRREE
ncbi:DUF6779 domain-containing protein [Mycobacterium sp. SMC-4]|uniref:DUF6779 domain-containing protein n=1 Tax=Mycobacterium sp. SMC-4 TaxID=2857059 RepID=UPI0021B45D65|nr:DUF6779 domain-containing protein [Mycobacterium sp. SMC-4]UXA17625.1 hypothetical protein KXD98_23400 [Mycobacterium sp. SMC-4]